MQSKTSANAHSFDVIVAGAGPAGSTCALFLSRAGLRTLLLDKRRFPRDKICADNKTWICTSIVKELGLQREFEKLPKARITKMLFSTPGGHELLVPLEREKIARDGPQYNVRRMVFDDFLFTAAKREAKVAAIEGFTADAAIMLGGRAVGVRGHDAKGKPAEYYAKVIVGADGSESAIAKSLGINPVVQARHTQSLRAYYSGVKHDSETVELHYLKGVCPGYFWIFPVDAGLCNVGIGMPTQMVEKHGIDLRRKLLEIISSPRFSQRFSRAKRASSWGRWGLTIGGPRRRICGNGFVLAGDAANTAVTFAGEGCGPAMRSGKIAAQAISRAFAKKDFSEKTLVHEYEDSLWRVTGPENKGLSKLEFLATHPRIMDFAVKRAAKSKKLAALAASIGSDYSNARKVFSTSILLELIKKS